MDELFLARDPLGITPLYCSDGSDGFVFASQVAALLAAGVDRDLDPAGRAGFSNWGSVREPHTMFKALKPLPAGCWARVLRARPVPPVRWFDLVETIAGAAEGQPDILPSLREVLADSVNAHLEADVDVGIFLSAGIDSSVLRFKHPTLTEIHCAATRLVSRNSRALPETKQPLPLS